MSGWSEFFAMGGHGVFVWTSYGAFLAVLIANVVLAWLRGRAVRRRLARRLRSAPADAPMSSPEARSIP